jgi:serine/threonine protein kinase
VDGTPFGRYRLVALLGRGGMGEVWRAYDTATERVVALKVLPANFADDRVFQERFRREAKAAAGIDEPHIIPIFDFGEIEGRLYVTMRLIKGRDLQSLLTQGPLPPDRAVPIIEQIAQALHAAHKAGLVHRDIKPSNILLDDNDFAYLIDFGIARAAGETGLTNTGATIGTWSYMAPERFESGVADARADIYALACVLYESLTGAPPFPGDTLERIAVAHMLQPPPRPSARQHGVSAQMDAVIATGMAKQPDARYPTTVQLARAARDAITTPLPRPAPRPPQLPPTGFTTMQAPPPMSPPKPAQPPLPPTPQPTGRPKRWIVPAAALIVICVLAGGFVVWQYTRPSTNAPPPPSGAPASSAAAAIPTTTASSTTAAVPVVNFHEWQPFGGIDAQLSGDGRSALLDTHNTTQNWTTVWSGLIAPGPPQCGIHITGQARDISHTAGVAGGFGIGLTTLQKDASGVPALFGSAVQYDLGLKAYFAVRYPTAEAYSLQTAPLDHEWHQFDIRIDAQGWITADIDGKPTVHTQGSPVCGTPTLRVWAGSAEFRDFSVLPLNVNN